MHKIAKTFQFDSCHMLDGHNGKCHNLHGHTYQLQIEIQGELIKEGSSQAMVLDYSDLKRIVKKEIIDLFDHAFLYYKENENECKLANLLNSMERKVFALPCRSTAEGMSQFIYEQLSRYLPISKVILWETPTSFCEYQAN